METGREITKLKIECMMFFKCFMALNVAKVSVGL